MSLLKITDLSEDLIDLTDNEISGINGGKTVTRSSSITSSGDAGGNINDVQFNSQQVFEGASSFDLSKFSSFFD
jgi:hypothetical protein